MSEIQSMTDSLSNNRYAVNRFLDSLKNYPPPMRNSARSEFGARLVAARTRAGLSQTAAAKAVGMSQAAYGAAETTGQGSTKTAQLAALYGVNADWLATGTGEMLGPVGTSTPQQPDELEHALRVLARLLSTTDKVTRSAIASSFSLLATEPDQLKNVVATVRKLLPARSLARTSQDDQSAGLVFKDLGSGDLNPDGKSTTVQGTRRRAK